jgi:S1-C subfamily serine protease
MVVAQTGDPGYGVVIASVAPEGPAADAGVVRGDILLEIDGETLENSADLMRYLGDAEPGDEVELTVLHGDDERALTALLVAEDGRAYLGVYPCGGLHREVEVRLGSPGAVIVEVMADSPAEAAGLEEGDAILSVDGQKLDAEKGLADLIADYEPGDSVTLEIERPGAEPREVSVELGEHPEKEDVAYLGVRYAPFLHHGMLRGCPLPFDEFKEFDLDEMPFALPEGMTQGAIVRRVLEDSPASAAGLSAGEVITAIDGEPVESPDALTEAIAEREPGDEVVLTVFRPGDESEREVEVTLGEHPEEGGKAYLGVRIGGYMRMRHLEGERPFSRDFDFDFRLDREEWPRGFKFHWPPDERDDGGAGHLGESL